MSEVVGFVVLCEFKELFLFFYECFLELFLIIFFVLGVIGCLLMFELFYIVVGNVYVGLVVCFGFLGCVVGGLVYG